MTEQYKPFEKQMSLISEIEQLKETIKAKDAVIAEARECIKLGEQCIKHETFKDWQSLAKVWLEANK